jgi:hypothetical protein
MTRCRPSSLTILSPSEQQYLRWEDIEFLPNYDSRGLPVRITLRWIKGRRDIYDRRASKFKGVTFLITSCTEAANLPADLPWLLLVLGFERGLFAADTIEELLESPFATLPMVPEVARGPVFLAGLANTPTLVRDKPLLCSGFTSPLQQACREAGIGAYASSYCWRREFISYIGRMTSVSETKVLATHASAAYDMYTYYDYGVGDMDITPVRLGEIDAIDLSATERRSARRNEIRQWLTSPALNRQREYPTQEEYAYVNEWFSNREDVLAWNVAHAQIMGAFYDRFSLEGPKNATSVIRELRSAPVKPGKTTTMAFRKPDPLYDLDAWLLALDNVVDATQAAIAFKMFVDTRLILWKSLRRALKRSFRKQWFQQSESVTIEDKAAREAATKKIPNVLIPKTLGNQSASSPSPAVHAPMLDDVLPFSYQAPEDINLAFEGNEEEMEGEDIAADEDAIESLSKEMEELAVGETALDEYVDEMNEDVDIIIDRDLGMGPSKSTAAIMDHRRQLMQIWLGITEVHRGKQSCPFCECAVVQPDSTIFFYGAKVCRHLQVKPHVGLTTHGNYLGLYMDSCITSRRVSGQSGKEIVEYTCRLCSQKFSDNSDKKFRKHLKEDHVELYENLTSGL